MRQGFGRIGVGIIALLALALGQIPARAQDNWKYFGNAKILALVQWQDGSPLYFELAQGQYCYVPAAEKAMVAMIMALYSTGKAADYHRAGISDLTFGGIVGYRLHRVIGR